MVANFKKKRDEIFKLYRKLHEYYEYHYMSNVDELIISQAREICNHYEELVKEYPVKRIVSLYSLTKEIHRYYPVDLFYSITLDLIKKEIIKFKKDLLEVSYKRRFKNHERKILFYETLLCLLKTRYKCLPLYYSNLKKDLLSYEYVYMNNEGEFLCLSQQYGKFEKSTTFAKLLTYEQVCQRLFGKKRYDDSSNLSPLKGFYPVNINKKTFLNLNLKFNKLNYGSHPHIQFIKED